MPHRKSNQPTEPSSSPILGDQDALASPTPAAVGGGGVGAVAEVAERVEEDGLRRGAWIVGVDRRRDRELWVGFGHGSLADG